MINHSGQWPAMPGQTIGANFENALAAIDQPGSEFYVPYPTNEMSCDSVAANIQLLNTFINVWNGRLRDAERQLIRSRETISNCQTIIRILSTKLGQYQVKEQACLNPVIIEPVPVPDETNTNEENENGGSGGSSWLLPVALGAAAILFIRSRRKRTVVRRLRK